MYAERSKRNRTIMLYTTGSVSLFHMVTLSLVRSGGSWRVNDWKYEANRLIWNGRNESISTIRCIEILDCGIRVDVRCSFGLLGRMRLQVNGDEIHGGRGGEIGDVARKRGLYAASLCCWTKEMISRSRGIPRCSVRRIRENGNEDGAKGLMATVSERASGG